MPLDYVRRRKPSADPLPHQRADLRRWWASRSVAGESEREPSEPERNPGEPELDTTDLEPDPG